MLERLAITAPLCAVLLLLIATPLPAAASQSAPDPDWTRQSGEIEALIDRGEDLADDDSLPLYQQALDLATTLTAAFPDSAHAHYLLALAQGRKALFMGGKDMVRMSRDIKRNIDEALRLDPEHADGLLLRGAYYRRLATLNGILKLFAKVFFGGLPEGSLTDAHGDLEQGLRLKPESVALHYYLGWTLYDMRDYEASWDLLKDIDALPDRDNQDPEFKDEARRIRGKLCQKLKRR